MLYFRWNTKINVFIRHLFLPKIKVENNDYVFDFSSRIFWDTKICALDLRKNHEFIIERALYYGTKEDEKLLYKIYFTKTIKKTILNLNYLPGQTVAYSSSVFNIPEGKFRCFAKTPVHVNC